MQSLFSLQPLGWFFLPLPLHAGGFGSFAQIQLAFFTQENHTASIVDQKLFVTDPDPTFQRVPDPTFKKLRILPNYLLFLQNYDCKVFKKNFKT
jgi:hypothetical protein